MINKNWYIRLLVWREGHIKERNFILILSFVIGLLAALAAFILKYIIHLIQNLLTSHFVIEGANYLYLVYPAVGILLAGLFVRYIVKDDISHGVTKILYALSQRKSRIKPHNNYSSIIASSITIGFGGSVGAEAPIVLTGSAIGSSLGQLFKMPQNVLMLLVGCGAAGAIAGIFKAPIAGLVFVLEVLMLDLTMTSLLPLLITSITAATVSYIFTDSSAMFSFANTIPFDFTRVPSVILLGIFCGLISLYFTRTMNFSEGIFRKINSPLKKLALGGVLLSILIFIFPPLYGEGYNTILMLINYNSQNLTDGSLFYQFKDTQWGIFAFAVAVMLMKVFAASATNGGGGTGGIFAPTLFIGCLAGFVFAYGMNQLNLFPYLPENNFALFGMAGLMSGVMHAPLTGIFLIAELTGGYNFLIPLMIVSTVAYLTIKIFEPHSIYSMRLAKKGELLTHHKDQTVLTLMEMDSLIEKDFETVTADMYLGDVVKVIAKAKRNIFPVLAPDGRLIGLVLLDDIRNIMFRPELYDRFQVRRFMISAPDHIQVGQSMDSVMKTFDQCGAWNLPVVDNGRYIGFVSKSKIFTSYRKVLVNLSKE